MGRNVSIIIVDQSGKELATQKVRPAHVCTSTTATR